MGPREQARRVLFAALDPSPNALADVAPSHLEGLSWDWLFERVHAHKVQALVAERLFQLGLIEGLPSGIRRRLEAVRRASQTRVERTARTMEELNAICGRLGVPFFFVKGVHLSEYVYGDARLRAYGDVDVVMNKADIEAVEAELLGSGYFFYAPRYLERTVPKRLQRQVTRGLEPGSPEARRQLVWAFHRNFNFVLRDGDPRLPVEVHWHIALPGLLKAQPEELWAETETRTLLGMPARVLNLEATLLHTALHAMEHLPTGLRLLHFLDVAWIVERVGDGIDPGRLQRLARAWGCETDLICALEVVESVFPFPMPNARRLVPTRRAWSRRLLKLAGASDLLELELPEGRIGLLADQIRREALWELALRKRPRKAMRRLKGLSAALRRRLPVAARREHQPNGHAPALERQLGPDLYELATGMGGTLRAADPLTSLPSPSSSRASFRLVLSDTRVFKGRRLEGEEAALRVHRLAAYLDPRHYPHVLKRRGAALLTRWVDGQPVGNDALSDEDLARYGYMLGELHTTGLPDDTLVRLGFPFASWHDRIETNLTRLEQLAALDAGDLSRARQLVERERPATAAVGLVHGDFCPENIVVAADHRPWVVDSENLAVDAFAFDLARTCYRWPLQGAQLQAFLDGYSRARDPSDFVEHMGYWCVAALTEAARFRMERTTRDAGLPLRRLHALLDAWESAP